MAISLDAPNNSTAKTAKTTVDEGFGGFGSA